MFNIINGVYDPWSMGMGQARSGGNIVRLPASFSGPRTAQDISTSDSARAAAISSLANRSVSFRVALENLDAVESYLSGLE